MRLYQKKLIIFPIKRESSQGELAGIPVFVSIMLTWSCALQILIVVIVIIVIIIVIIVVIVIIKIYNLDHKGLEKFALAHFLQ